MDENVKRTLEKQLELLSERSKGSTSDKDLADLTHAMVEVVTLQKSADVYSPKLKAEFSLEDCYKQISKRLKDELYEAAPTNY